MIDTLMLARRLEEAGMERRQADVLVSTLRDTLDKEAVSRETFEAGINQLDVKIDRLDAKLDSKIDTSVTHLDAKIDRLDAKLDASTGRLQQQYDIILKVVWAIAAGIIGLFAAVLFK